MRKSHWTPAKTDALLAFAALGLSRREIAYRMCLTVVGITAKLRIMGVNAPLNPPGYQPLAEPTKLHLAHLARFPRFEDITREEAARVRAGAPASAPFERLPDYSLCGNAAALCVS